ncbi:MAG: EAL domain-containing protein [Campylobacterota bacterium]
MLKIIISKKLFWFVAGVVIVANMAMTYYLYTQTQDLIEKRAQSRADALKEYFISMRFIFHQQFLQSGLEITDSTVGFLPAHASSLISDTFAQRIKDGTSIKNISDRPRNPTNKADDHELEAIEYFKNHPKATARMQMIEQEGKKLFFYSSPILIQQYCIACHGKKDEVLPYVAKRYNTAYGYEVGDVRGITSIKIPLEMIAKDTMKTFWHQTYFSWAVILLALSIVYYVIHQFLKKQARQKRKLQDEVSKKTIDLQKANQKQRHIFSILRTVADCNQVLITAQTLNDLIQKTAQTMHKNSAFAGIKIMLEQEGRLQVVSSLGLDEELEVYPLEQNVFESNKGLRIDSVDEKFPKECVQKVQKYNIKEVYVIPLKADATSKQALGVMTICSTDRDGFDPQEIEMIEELAGDLGFAINSFIQKRTIDRLSYYDSLTNIANKKYLLRKLSAAITQAKKDHNYGGLLYINIDNFKSINDVRGMGVGDQVLKYIAQKLSDLIGQNSSVFHVGGDEFVILLQHLGAQSSDAVIASQKQAELVLEEIKDPIVVDKQDVFVTFSIGVVVFIDNKEGESQLLNNAESAMHVAKNSGKNSISFYDTSFQEAVISRSFIIRNLQEAYNQNQFFLLYQKQVDQDQKIIGVEALIRWKHPDLGVVSPATFIPLAEESGFIIELGSWVAKEAIAQLHRWADDPIKKSWRVSINVSPLQFKDPEFVPRIAALIQEYGVKAKLLRIELTEGVFISDTKNILTKLNKLKKLGFSISIDDFGTGYSSLAYLKQMPIDELKIDQSFVANLSDESADKTIVETVVAMGQTFGFDILAEGVETKKQFKMLKNMGCEYFQGYYFAKPIEPKEL